MSGPLSGLTPAELRGLLGDVAASLAGAEAPRIIGAEEAGVVEGRAVIEYAVPQWTTAAGEARGLRLRAWSYAQRRDAEQLATERRPHSPIFGQVNDWRRMAEEVRLAILSPPELPLTVIESWGYDVVSAIHAQVERLGPVPATVLAAALAGLVGGPPPPPSARPDRPSRSPGGDDPDELGEPAPEDTGLDGATPGRLGPA